jgi:hypothetical protein
MHTRTKWIAGGTLLAVLGGSTGIAVANGVGDDAPLSGSARQRAIAAALRSTGGGTVVETEAGDDGAAYGVEIRLPDGGSVDVSLDERFNVIRSEDDDGAGPDDGQGDD